jgi:nifR3 family TIM-barrel protein
MHNFSDLNTALWYIGDIPIKGKLILAPMEGISDQPYRVICRQMGAAISYTEFVSALEILNKHPYRVEQRVSFLEEERPISIQIFDNEPERLVQAVYKLLDLKPDIIDINMGCSAKTVSNRGAGAGLLQTPKKIQEIFSTLSKTLKIPVTGKIRLGWDEDSLNYLEIAKIIEDNGGSALAVHGRTRKQSYTGTANWDAIAEIKQSVTIPVIANGDVKKPKDVINILKHTGADAVMIGRKAIGNPWIFSGIPSDQVPFSERLETMHNHIQAMAEFYTEHTGVVLFRKHAVAYLRQYPMNQEERRTLLTTTTVDSFVNYLSSLQLENRAFLSPH